MALEPLVTFAPISGSVAIALHHRNSEQDDLSHHVPPEVDKGGLCIRESDHSESGHRESVRVRERECMRVVHSHTVGREGYARVAAVQGCMYRGTSLIINLGPYSRLMLRVLGWSWWLDAQSLWPEFRYFVIERPYRGAGGR